MNRSTQKHDAATSFQRAAGRQASVAEVLPGVDVLTLTSASLGHTQAALPHRMTFRAVSRTLVAEGTDTSALTRAAIRPGGSVWAVLAAVVADTRRTDDTIVALTPAVAGVGTQAYSIRGSTSLTVSLVGEPVHTHTSTAGSARIVPGGPGRLTLVAVAYPVPFVMGITTTPGHTLTALVHYLEGG
jgi:hypothetical protein